jgi:hypothetical protein
MSDTKIDLPALRALCEAHPEPRGQCLCGLCDLCRLDTGARCRLSRSTTPNQQWHIAREECMDAFPALLDEVERLTRERDEYRASLERVAAQRDSANNHAHAMRSKLEEMTRERDEHEALLALYDLEHSCAVCGSDLLPRDEPPRCCDCILENEEDEDWRSEHTAALSRLDESRGKKEGK